MPSLSERILSGIAGEYVDRPIDRAYFHDGTGVLTLETWRALGTNKIARPSSVYVLFDHIVPANNSTTADLQHELRKFAVSSGLHFSDSGGGICHQLMGEGIALPGEIIAGADSHTCTLGAFGAFATGVGATDMAAILASGSTWFRIPETIGLYLTGTLCGSAEAKDLALTYVARLGMDGGTYHALEFMGDGVTSLSMDSRLTLCNLSVETGAKTGMFYADNVTREYLMSHGHEILVQDPPEPTCSEEYSFDLGAIEPVIAAPPRVDSARPVDVFAGIPLDQVFVGTCTNGRYEDLFRFAEIVRGKKVKVRTIIGPASRTILLEAARTGLLSDLVAAGCTVLPPGCGPCLGAHMGVIGEGEVCLSTSNRNFRNRMGVGGEIYLSSVATAAASALKGEITVPGGGE
jgi:methanogen homoaconitase large subunit